MKLSSLLFLNLLLLIPQANATDFGCSLPNSHSRTDAKENGVMQRRNIQLTNCLKRKDPVIAIVTPNADVPCIPFLPGSVKLRTPAEGTQISVYYNEQGGDILFSKGKKCKSGDVESIDHSFTAAEGIHGVCKDFGSGNAPSDGYLNYLHAGKDEVKKCNQERIATAGGQHGNKNHSEKAIAVNHSKKKTGITQKTYESGKNTIRSTSGNQ